MAQSTMVFGDDGSISADLAWLWINSHPWPGWRVEVLTAVTPADFSVHAHPALPYEWVPPHPRSPFAEAQIGELATLTIETDPRLALSRAADLLVVGPRGPGLAKAMHLGSTVEWLLTHPPAPMLVPRHGRRTRSAVICHDGSRHAQAAVTALCRMPWSCGLQVTVVSVDDGFTDADHAVDMATWQLRAARVDVHHHIIRNGVPTLDLLDFLEKHDTDLVVLGTHGLTGFRRLRVGSTAGVLAHGTPHSVLLACADDTDTDTGGEARDVT